MSSEGPLQSRRPAYRPDIDGLRAVAVASVILFHARIPGADGGYVGVDVFFVISGYLITQLLAGSDATRLQVSLKEFYLRRARRILPALYVAALTAAVAAVLILLPWDLPMFGRYLLAAPLFASNLPAWLDGDNYFGHTADQMPLTHFWSIAVEEQFYFLYPLTLLLIGRTVPRHRSWALAALAAVSLAVCIWGSYHKPTANFFFAPPRAWELLLGAMLATSMNLRIRSRLANELLAGTALLTLLLTVICYGPLLRYPGLYTIAPCVAAGLLIVTGREQPTLVNRLLSLRPLVFTGLISYSLYLWHLPILVLGRYYNILPLNPLTLGALLVGTYLLAVGSWKVVEKPIRSRSSLRSDRVFVSSAVACAALICAIALMLWKTTWVEQALATKVRAPDLTWLANTARLSKCVNRGPDIIATGDLCSFGPQDEGAARVLVWGDSHAMAALVAYEKLAVEQRVRTYFAVKPGCRPLADESNTMDRESLQSACKAFNTAVVSAIGHLEPRLVILNAHWGDKDAEIGLSAGAIPAPGESRFRAAVEHTLAEIGVPNRRAVCIVLDVPAFRYDVSYALGMASKRGIAADFLTVTRADGFAQYSAPERDFRQLQERGLITTVDPKELLCRGNSCAYESDGRLLYADQNHLSRQGALMISSALEGCLRGLSGARSQ